MINQGPCAKVSQLEVCCLHRFAGVNGGFPTNHKTFWGVEATTNEYTESNEDERVEHS